MIQERGYTPANQQPELEQSIRNHPASRQALLEESKVIEKEIDKIAPPSHYRSSTLPSNRLFVNKIPGYLFSGVEYIKTEAERMEDHRGKQGFSPETIKYVFPEGVFSISALEQVVLNYAAWFGGKIPDRPKFR